MCPVYVLITAGEAVDGGGGGGLTLSTLYNNL